MIVGGSSVGFSRFDIPIAPLDMLEVFGILCPFVGAGLEVVRFRNRVWISCREYFPKIVSYYFRPDVINTSPSLVRTAGSQ